MDRLFSKDWDSTAEGKSIKTTFDFYWLSHFFDSVTMTAHFIKSSYWFLASEDDREDIFSI